MIFHSQSSICSASKLVKNTLSGEIPFFLHSTGGTRFAPSYANLFMNYWEEEHVWKGHEYGGNLVSWHRFIDDVLFIWKGSKEDLDDFCSYLNANNKNIKITFNISKTGVNFLDLVIYPKKLKINTMTYYKKTDVNSYIDIMSGHHMNWLKSIPIGQFKRIRRNCTESKLGWTY